MTAPSESPESPAPRGKVLVIDDSELTLSLVKKRLETAGYQVFTTTNANCVFLIVKEKPDLVLMDVNMPGLKGDVSARMLVLSGGSGQSSVVVLHSDLPDETLQQKVKSTGVAGYIPKVVEEERFLAEVDHWVKLARSRRAT